MKLEDMTQKQKRWNIIHQKNKRKENENWY